MATNAASDTTFGRTGSPVNVLLVDDSPAKLLTYETMLEELGENLIRANSGNEALEQLLKKDIAVILLDVNMPGIDGFELASMIRRHPRFQKTAIIHVSAVNLSEIDQVKGYESGAVDYVSVPVVPQILRAKVRVFADLYRKSRELERLNRELEDRVADRTAQLEMSLERLREDDRRKDEFLAMLAHELRNPLAAIRNALDVVRQAPTAGERARRGSEVIERQTQQLSRLIDDLLDVSRIARDKLVLRRHPIELAHVVAAVIEPLRVEIERRGLQLRLGLPDQPVPLAADAVRLGQVFANLMDNAVKFTPAGGQVGFEAARDGASVRVRVWDSGLGIAPDVLPQVFEMFYQADKSLERSHGGLGVGLALARRLTEMHGGTIEASSDGLGKGSLFEVRLPILSEATPVATPPAAISALAPAPRKASLPLRVLVADDNVDSAQSLEMILALNGHELMVAHDGQQTLERAERFRPQVMLLDIGMPRVSGHDVARRIRETPWGKDVLLIATTGWGQAEDLRRTSEAGFDLHLVKPFEPSVVLSAIADWSAAREKPPRG